MRVRLSWGESSAQSPLLRADCFGSTMRRWQVGQGMMGRRGGAGGSGGYVEAEGRGGGCNVSEVVSASGDGGRIIEMTQVEIVSRLWSRYGGRVGGGCLGRQHLSRA